MNKERAIIELASISRQCGVIEAAVAALGEWTDFEELTKLLQKKEEEILERMDELMDIVNGEKMNIDKAFE